MMSKKQSIAKEELAELYSEALDDFREFFRGKTKEIREKNGKDKKKDQPET